jgi:hypothetical protein
MDVFSTVKDSSNRLIRNILSGARVVIMICNSFSKLLGTILVSIFVADWVEAEMTDSQQSGFSVTVSGLL